VYPETPLLDDFDRPDAPLLTAWQWQSGPDFPAALGCNDDALEIVTQQLVQAARGFNSCAYWHAVFTPDQEVYCTVAVGPGAPIDLFARIANPTSVDTTAYVARFGQVPEASNYVQLFKMDHRGIGPLFCAGYTSIAGPVDTAPPHQIGLRICGDRLEAYIDGAVVLAVTDTAFNNMGYIGLALYDNAVTLDDFGGGGITTCGGPAPSYFGGGIGMTNQSFMESVNDALFVQPHGANTQPQYLPCYMVDGDLTEPQGTHTMVWCDSPDVGGGFVALGMYQDAPGGPVAFKLTTKLAPVIDALRALKCKAPFYVLQKCSGKKDIFPGWNYAIALQSAYVAGNKTWSNLKTTESNSVRTYSQDMEALPPVLEHVLPSITLVTYADTVNGIAACPGNCQTACGPATVTCSNLWAAVAAIGAAKPKVRYSTDGGATWTNTAADPFAVSEDVAFVLCLPVGGSVNRIIIGRGTTDAGNPAEIGYSDDGGATWTYMNIGTVVAHFFVGGKSAYMLDPYQIWLCDNLGYIYKLDGVNLTYTTQEAGVLNAGAWNAIMMYDNNYGIVGGAADELAYTSNGGVAWEAMTATGGGGAINTVALATPYRAWVGDSTGDMYYCEDAGPAANTWVQRNFSGHGAGAVTHIVFVNELTGWLVHNSVAIGRVFKTINGGWDWELQTVPAQTSLNYILPCDLNSGIVGGVS
jgi:hypothetical protein